MTRRAKGERVLRFFTGSETASRSTLPHFPNVKTRGGGRKIRRWWRTEAALATVGRTTRTERGREWERVTHDNNNNQTKITNDLDVSRSTNYPMRMCRITPLRLELTVILELN